MRKIYYANAKLLYPSLAPALDPESRLPDTASLSGIAYDYTDGTLITYDRTEYKLLWIDVNSGALIASCTVDTPVDEVLGMSSFKDQLCILTYEGDGHLAVFTGSIQQGRTSGVLQVVSHPVPYATYNPSGVAVWDRTHEMPPSYFRYHPDFCNIFMVGPTIYLLLGVASGANSSGTIPASLGQYIVEYDLNGLFRSPVKVDLSVAGVARERTIYGPNGTAVAVASHNGVVSLLCRELSDGQPSIVHVLSYNSGSINVEETFWYMVGDIVPYADMLALGRYLYVLMGNRIWKSEIMMIALTMPGGWPSATTLDLGNISAEQTIFRKVRCQNVAPVSTYYDMHISTTDPNLLLSLGDDPDVNDFANHIVRTGALAPGEYFDFWVCLTAPTITHEYDAPYQYYNKITFAPREQQDYV